MSVQGERANLRELLHRYRNRPMSLADACLVRMSEIHRGSEIFTLDGDFRIYRRFGNKVIEAGANRNNQRTRRYAEGDLEDWPEDRCAILRRARKSFQANSWCFVRRRHSERGCRA